MFQNGPTNFFAEFGMIISMWQEVIFLDDVVNDHVTSIEMKNPTIGESFHSGEFEMIVPQDLVFRKEVSDVTLLFKALKGGRNKCGDSGTEVVSFDDDLDWRVTCHPIEKNISEVLNNFSATEFHHWILLS